ncbi:unnamed protein product [Owenia fusiformis]|uniref:Uncharacterized protein n=1 Tax=Owenia fusiformis TaxID=6347 RepID=A0A8J1U6V3_OWEFU|nr:unnamed protein product [Owenia fusiformis]
MSQPTQLPSQPVGPSSTVVPPPDYDTATGSQGGYTNPTSPQGGYSQYPGQGGYTQQEQYPQNAYNTPKQFAPNTGCYVNQGSTAPPGAYVPPPTEFVPHDAEAGLTAEEEEQFSSFTDKAVRHGFIRKVYGILTLQLLVTMGIMALFMFQTTVREYVRYKGSWLVWTGMIGTIVLILVLGCIPNVRKKFPVNLICLIIFTIFFSLMLGTLSTYLSVNEVLMAVGICAVIVLGVTIFAVQTKIDFTMMSGSLFMLLISLLCFGVLCAIFRDRYLYMMYAALGALLFGLWLLIDTQMILGGKHTYSIDPEEYIFAALSLYVDIMNILIRIMAIIGASR